MGITYPKSLEIYDLKLRYTTPGNVTRTALEQDIGRVCRYKDDSLEEYPLPTVYISGACKDAIMAIMETGQREDVKYVPPANPEKMLHMKNKTSHSIQHGSDLSYFQENFLPGKRNMDNTNTIMEKFKTRYLLFGLPQCGKTGSFLELIYQIWKMRKFQTIKEPLTASDIIFDFDIEEEEDDTEVEKAVKNDETISVSALDYTLHTLNDNDFPPFNIYKEMSLNPLYPPKSSRYGDPKLQEDRDHYIMHKKTYPPERLLIQECSSLIERMDCATTSSTKEHLPSTSSATTDNNATNEIQRNMFRTDATKYGSRQLTYSDAKTDIHTLPHYKSNYNLYTFPFGALYLNKEMAPKKWTLNEISHPSINPNITLIPIVICSSGRATTGLFDLTKAMEGKEIYIQIIIIREEEENDYLSLTHHYPNIDILVLPTGTPHKIGSARKRAKEMSESLFKQSVFLMDDNIRGWSRISFQNDDQQNASNQNRVVDEDISLLSLLEYFHCHSKEMENYSMIGFQFSKRGIKTCKEAFSRKHVYGAVILNLKKTESIQYDDAWAMEDINFNLKTNQLWTTNKNEGVIVKFQRFIASKKAIKRGGVVPYNIPPHLIELMKYSKHWGNNIKVNCEKGEKEKSYQKCGVEKASPLKDTEQRSSIKRGMTDGNQHNNVAKESKRRKSDSKSTNVDNKENKKGMLEDQKELEKAYEEKNYWKKKFEKADEEKGNFRAGLEKANHEIEELKKNLEKSNEDQKDLQKKFERVKEENYQLENRNAELRQHTNRTTEKYVKEVRRIEIKNEDDIKKIKLVHQEEIKQMNEKHQKEKDEITSKMEEQMRKQDMRKQVLEKPLQTSIMDLLSTWNPNSPYTKSLQRTMDDYIGKETLQRGVMDLLSTWNPNSQYTKTLQFIMDVYNSKENNSKTNVDSDIEQQNTQHMQ